MIDRIATGEIEDLTTEDGKNAAAVERFLSDANIVPAGDNGAWHPWR